MTKNKGIIIHNGSLTSENITIGKKSKIKNTPKSNLKNNKSSILDENSLAIEFKKLISQGELKIVIQKLLDLFKDTKKSDALNIAIMHSSSLTELELKENLGVIDYEQGKIHKAKITKSVLSLIDDKIK